MFGVPSIKFLTGVAVGVAAGYAGARYFECKAAGVPLKIAFTPSNLLTPVYNFPGILPPDPNRPTPREMMTSYRPLFALDQARSNRPPVDVQVAKQRADMIDSQPELGDLPSGLDDDDDNEGA